MDVPPLEVAVKQNVEWTQHRDILPLLRSLQAFVAYEGNAGSYQL
jgi:hypothetical protein